MKRNGAAHRGGRASVRWQGEAGVVAFRRWRMALEGGGSPASTLQVGEMMGQVRGGLSGKSEEGCVRAGVLTGDGGTTAFHEADGGRNGAATWRKEEGAGGGGRWSATCEQGRVGWRAWTVREGVGWPGKGGRRGRPVSNSADFDLKEFLNWI
jgi:hypothetical protein